MKFDIGNEQRFFDFIKDLNDKDKIALISHTDLDGMVAPYVASKVIRADLIKFVNYDDLNLGLVQYLKENKISKVIFTDLFIGDQNFVLELEKFAHVLILDHHISKRDWNSSRTTFLKGEEGICAGYLCYYLFSKLKNIDNLDWLVACSCISDYCHIKTSEWLDKVFTKYNDKFERVGTYVRTSGSIWDLQEALSLAIIYHKKNLLHVFENIRTSFGDIGNLREDASKVREEVQRLVNLFDKEKQKFDGGYLFEFSPKYSCGSMVSTILSGNNIHSTILTLRPDLENNSYHVSARRQDKQVNMNDFLKKLLEGFEKSDAGGHVPAAGGSFPMEFIGEFKRRLGVKA